MGQLSEAQGKLADQSRNESEALEALEQKNSELARQLEEKCRALEELEKNNNDRESLQSELAVLGKDNDDINQKLNEKDARAAQLEKKLKETSTALDKKALETEELWRLNDTNDHKISSLNESV